MEDRLFELVEKMYSDITGKLDKVDSRLDNLESEVKGLRKDVVCIENDLKPKIGAALDGYQQVYEKLQEHDKRFDKLENTFHDHDVKIHAIK